jgi:hypothetical protein
MAKLALKKAETDVTVYLFAQDSSKTTGVGLTDLVYNTSGLSCYYIRPLAAAAAISLATQTVDGAHSDGGFVAASTDHMPGVYRLDLPDAVCATGVDSALVMLHGAANLAPTLLEIQLTDFDLNDASPNVSVYDMAADSITAAALKADAVTEIQTGLALEATLTAIKGAGWIDETLAALMTAIEAIETGSGGGATADEIWDELLSGHTSAGSAGKALSDILTDTGTDIPALIAALSAWQASAVTSAVSSGTITDVRGSSWSIAIEDLTLDSNKQQFAIKRNAGDLDAQALLLVDSATGLLTLNGVSSGLTAGDASLVYAGTTLTLTVKPNITAQIPSGAWKYGVQYVTAAGLVEEPYGGTFTVSPDVVRAAS